MYRYAYFACMYVALFVLMYVYIQAHMRMYIQEHFNGSLACHGPRLPGHGIIAT